MAGEWTTLKSKNPIYERVLIQLIESETSPEKKSIYTLCLKSLRLFPLPLESPMHCRILEGFTKKVVHILEEKLKNPPVSLSPISKPKAWDDPVDLPSPSFLSKNSRSDEKKKRNLSPLSSSDEDIENVFAPSSYRKKIKKTTKIKSSEKEDNLIDAVLTQNGAIPRKNPIDSNPNSAEVPLIDLDELDEEVFSPNSSQSSGSRNSSSSQKKEYVPRTGSGAYAVLMTLFKKTFDPLYPGYMTKEQIMTEAQIISNESFTRSRDPQSYYTAWSGVSILEKKGLTRSWSQKPKKFQITETGINLAKRIADVEKDSTNDTASFHSVVQSPAQSQSTNVTFEQASWLDRLSDLRYCYVKDSRGEGVDTNLQDEAEMDIENGIHYLIKCRKVDLEGSTMRYRIKRSLSNGIVMAFLHESDVLDSSPVSSSKDLIPPSVIEEPILTYSPPKDKVKKSRKKKETTPVVGSDPIEGIIFDGEDVDPHKDFRFWIKSDTLSNERRRDSCSSHVYDEEIISEFTLFPNQYEVILLVDTAEVQSSKPGGKATRREITCDELNSNGVKYEKRKMNIGDFLWIAKEKVEINAHSFRQREPRELVLPYVIERKRMDDLQQSIVDQRYAEQKFRMKNSGIRNLYYLVENCRGMDKNPSGGRGGISASALEQSIANTAVQEGFCIHRTKDQKESMEFITTMTRNLIEKYSGTTLVSCEKDDIVEGRIKHFDRTLLTYKEFNDLSKKNKNLMVKEIFMKMLLQLKGLTPGMALSIVNKYPTPIALSQAYVGKNEKERNTLLQGIKYDEGKKIPINVSRSIGILFSNETLI